MSEVEIKERLARIEVLLEGITKKMDGDDRKRDKCYERIGALEEFVDTMKGSTAATDKMLGKIVSIITIVNIITLLVLKTAFHI